MIESHLEHHVTKHILEPDPMNFVSAVQRLAGGAEVALWAPVGGPPLHCLLGFQGVPAYFGGNPARVMAEAVLCGTGALPSSIPDP